MKREIDVRDEIELQGQTEARPDDAAVEGFELSPQQRRAWELARAGGLAPYHAQLVVDLGGPLDAAALASVVRAAVARHEILRTSLRQPPGMLIPVQVVADEAAAELQNFDLTGLTPDGQRRRLDAWLDGTRRATTEGAAVSPDEVSNASAEGAGVSHAEGAQASPLRVALFAVGSDRHALALSLPTLCADRDGLDNLLAEIARDYAAAANGDDAPDAETLQYADLAAWQNELAAAEESEPGRAHWRESCPRESAATRLPATARSARLSDFAPRVAAASLGADTLARIEELAARGQTDAANVLLACWQLLAARLAGEPEATVGVRFGGRKYEELRAAVGPLARYLPVRCEVAADKNFAELLAATAAASEVAAKWQECFAWELAGARPGEDEAAPPFAPLAFDFAAESEALEAAGVSFAPRAFVECLDPFQAKLACRRRGDALRVELHYDASLLDADDAARLLERFETLLTDALRRPSSPVAELEIVGPSERRRLLAGFNDTRAELRTDTTLQELFEAQVARTPARVAVTSEGGELTYAELNARANRLAHYLKGRGVGPDVPVGLCLERSAEMLVALLGVLKAGGAYVPLDPDYPRERLEFMAEDAGFPVLLTQSRLLARADGERAFTPSAQGRAAQASDERAAQASDERAAQVFCLDTDWDAAAGESDANPAPSATPDNLAYVIYTSGSTGKPKGVAVSHRAIANRLLWMQSEHPLAESDSVLQKTAFSFDASVWELFLPLITGARLVMARPGGHQDAAYLAEAIRQHGVTTLQLVPTMLAVMLDEPEFARCDSLRRMWCGGEAVSPELQRRFFSTFAETELHNLYGPTETAIDASHWLCERESARAFVPIGRPLANLRVYILDSAMRPAPVGVAGELYVGGVQLARGYWRRPGLTAERFVPDPFSTDAGARLYRTGDLARWTADGVLEYLGRADHQVKLRGFRVELGEIETTLAAHPSVRDCVVLIREDRPGDRRLVAYFVPAAREVAPERDELRRFAAERLPDYMTPAAFVALEQLPRAPNGKLDRRALPPPPAEGAYTGQEFVAPRDEVERELARLWEEVLGVAPVGINDNFFELGGHSVLALRVVGQIGKRFGKEVPLASMIQAGTIESLARLLRAEPRLLPWDPLVTIQPAGTRTPLFAVHSIGGQVFCYVALARHLGTDQPTYGLQAPPLDDVGNTNVSIEEMAAHYVKAMRDVQPAGPYQLCGYSFGVMVAFEIARQLRAQGDEVALVALLDSPSPRYLHKLPPYEDDDAFMFALRGKVAAFERGRTIEMTRDEFDGLDYEEQLRRFHRRMTEEDLFPPEHDIEFLRNFMQGYKTRQKAVRFYHPDPYPGRISLFRAKETDPWMVEQFARAGVDLHDPTGGWSELTTEGVDIYEVPGNHDRMCYEPHVRVLARRMREAMDKARGDSRGAQGWAGKILRR